MGKIFSIIGNILCVGTIIWDVIGFLALPVLFLIIGLINSYPWLYYVISIGGYFALDIVLEILLRFVLKKCDKKYIPYVERKLEKYFNMIFNRK